MQILKLNPTTIKIKDGLNRFRQDLGEVRKLSDSITRYGQLQPIGITHDKELVWGGRRVAACILAELDVLAVYQDDVDEILHRELEIEENLQRKNFTPGEEALAVAAKAPVSGWQSVGGNGCAFSRQSYNTTFYNFVN